VLTEDLVDVPVEVFGGYCPAIVPDNLPPGAANVCQDMQFPEAGARTRGGLAPYILGGTAVIPANASVNGLKSYLTPTGAQQFMIWDSLGDMFYENPQGFLNLINSRPYQNLLYQSQTLFSREYQAFSNTLGGFDIPRQWDGTHWDRVSHTGPAASPTASDISFPIVSVSRAATTGIITVLLDMPFGSAIQTTYVAPGLFFTLNGVTADASLDGSFPIATVTSEDGGLQTQLTLWGGYGDYQISSMSRAGGLVTAQLSQTPNLTASETIIIGGAEDPSYNGIYTVSTISGNTVTWPQSGTASTTAGGALYVQNYTAAVYSVVSLGYGQPSGGLPAFNLFGNQVTQFPAGWDITVSGNTQPDGDGTFVISSNPPPAYFPPGTASLPPSASATGLTVVYFGTPGTFTIGFGGTAVASPPASSPTPTGTGGPTGHISQGLHQVSVAFINRQGFISKGAPPMIWGAGGNLLASLSNIATGPPNIAQRLLLFTPVISSPATTGTFYSLPTGSTQLTSNVNPTLAVMLIPDNATTTWIIDFSDAILISGFQAEYLFNELELGESAFMLGYNTRTVWLGERARVSNFLNLGFDGGFGIPVAGFPNGWTFGFPGGGSAVAAGLPVDWGDAYVITGDGVQSIKGRIFQSAFQDYLNVPIIAANTSYSVRVRLAKANHLLQGTLNINLQSTIGGFSTPGLAVNAAQLTATYQEFTATLTSAPLTSPPSDLILQLYASNTPSAGGQFLIDSIEVFPTNTPFNSSIARLSYASNPEGFDAVTGQVQIRPGDGQFLRAGFPLRNSLYLAKDHYLGYVVDDGVNEPALWTFTEVSATIGICGPNAVDWNEEWAVFAERSGLYICWGSDPVKLTPEIQNDATFTGRTSWASINWAAASTIWVRIDRINKMILVGAPINGATTPNAVFMMDYRWLDSAEDIASSPMVTYSAFTGKILAHGRGRRWSIWSIAANSMCFAERVTGTTQPFFGNSVGNGLIYQQLDCKIQPTDNGATIPWSYQTYAVPSHQEEQMLQLRSHRKLAGYLKFRAVGSGLLNLAITTPARSTILRAYALSLNPAGDGERPLNLHAERFFITFSNSGVGSWAQLEKTILCVKKDAAMLTRGVSS
jgi:hypothetical protein